VTEWVARRPYIEQQELSNVVTATAAVKRMARIIIRVSIEVIRWRLEAAAGAEKAGGGKNSECQNGADHSGAVLRNMILDGEGLFQYCQNITSQDRRSDAVRE
jgi:hypothetical protein